MITTCEAIEVSGHVVVAVAGEIDYHSAPDVREACLREIEAHERVVIDLIAVDFMDSSGLGVLVAALKASEERDGTLKVVVPDGPVRRVMDVTKVTTRFAVFGSREEALA